MAEPTVITLGCRLNTYESEVMRRHAGEAGLENAVIINTCAVTAEAVRQAKQTVRRVRREQPNARIIVTGCAAQIDPEQFAALDEVDHVIGNAEKLQAATFQGLSVDNFERVVVNDIMSVTETASHMIDSFGSRTRAYVQVQNGCDHRCTFCIIPYGRGPSRSVPAGEVVSEIRRLVENGYLEIVLTGVDMTAYGRDLPGRMTLGKLVRKILRLVPELRRLRLSSIDQVEADADLLDAIAEEDRLMPHLHLSLQAGDDLILKRMKRRHTGTDAISFCERARQLRPDMVFGADLIAGFPTETDEMFANTVRVVEDCGLTYLHVFPFSPRKGTPAARMPQVAKPVIKERAAQLRRLGDQLLNTHLDAQAGQTFEVLMEKSSLGRTRQFTEVQVEGISAEPGVLIDVKTVGHDGRKLVGEAVI